jgi:hypothetical protein
MGICDCCCPSEDVASKNEKKVKTVELPKEKKYNYEAVDSDEPVNEDDLQNEEMDRNDEDEDEEEVVGDDNDDDDMGEHDSSNEGLDLTTAEFPRRADSLTIKSKTTSAASNSSFGSGASGGSSAANSKTSAVTLSHLAVADTFHSDELDEEYVEAVVIAESLALKTPEKKKKPAHIDMAEAATSVRKSMSMKEAPKLQDEEGEGAEDKDGGGEGGIYDENDPINDGALDDANDPLKEAEEEEFDFSKHEFTLNRRPSQEEVNAMFIQIYYDRFLKSEQGNVAKAAKRCHDTFKWRKTEDADFALEQVFLYIYIYIYNGRYFIFPLALFLTKE